VSTTVVFGVGNPDRGDDAAGWLVADLLGDGDGATIAVRRVAADPSAILTDPLWDAADHVIVVDTVCTGASPGTIHRWDLFELLDRAVPTGAGTHDLGIVTTLGLAAAMGRLPLDASVIGIEGCAFEPGEPPSHEVLAAVERVAAAIDVEVLLGHLAGDAGDVVTHGAFRAPVPPRGG
jgi:hydrogenase maturation protease